MARPGFKFWQILIRLALVAWFGWLVRDEFGSIFQWLRGVVQNGFDLTSLPLHSLIALSGWLFLFIIFYLCFILWFAQFILPVTSWFNRWAAFWRLLLYGISRGRWHGPAVFIRDGEKTETAWELEKHGPGVAFVDLRSAITLDKHPRRKGVLSPASLTSPQKINFGERTGSHLPGIRACGPGLVFTRKDEKISGTVDLRIQNRSRKGVIADTRDGIRVTTDVSCTFTIGQPPDILDVCLGGEDGSQILVIEWDEGPSVQEKKVKRLSRELDEGDEKEIHTFIMSHPDPTEVHTDVPGSQFPYSFDSQRVEQAVYSETSVLDPSSASSLMFKKWSDWPQDVAVEKFRILLAKWPYMNLYTYTPENPDIFPLKEFKKELSKQVRNTGILAFRVISLPDGRGPQVGQTYYTRELVFYPPRLLRRFDVLRYRGIKVLATGFGELEPKEKDVRNQMRASWKSGKQREADLKSADHMLEVARIKNQARVRTQQSMIYHLTQILENQEYPREALAMLIYQELEAAAANPETRRLLPEDTLSLLTGIGTILLQGDKGSGRPAGGTPILPQDESNP